MVRKAFIALLCAAMAAPAISQDTEADPLDKPVWVFFSRTNSVFWITARDMSWDQGPEPLTVWVHGDHRGDSSVRYRKSVQRVSLSCKGSARTTAYTAYNADESIFNTWDGFGNMDYIRPGSMMADLERKMCAAKK